MIDSPDYYTQLKRIYAHLLHSISIHNNYIQIASLDEQDTLITTVKIV